MAINFEKGGDIVLNGFEQGIQPSPHKGTANIQNANISTETGEVINSFLRVQDTMTNTVATGSLAYVDSSHVSLSIANTNNLFKGNWITVTGSSNTTELPNGTYYVPPSSGSNFQLQSFYNVVNNTPVTINYNIVGGGAGGGAGDVGSPFSGGGGGGGGQVKTGTTTLSASTNTITVGTGGAVSTNGVASVALGVTAAAGLAGGAAGTNGGTGGNSGSGKTGGTTAASSGGGGGAGDSANGSNTSSTTGGAGGNGTAVATFGSSVTYGGGGGGAGGGGTSGGAGGTGGGGTGGNSGLAATNGTANTGGGGGGGGAAGQTPGTGGSGIVEISYVLGSIFGATGGTITQYTASGITYNLHTFTSSGTFTIPTQGLLNTFTTGLTASFTMVATMGNPLASCTENYYSSGTPYNRYYILDSNNLVWVYDTINETTYVSTDNVTWFLPDTSTTYCTTASGIAVISGFLVVTATNGAFAKPTVLLGNTNSTTSTWSSIPDIIGWNGVSNSASVPHFAYANHATRLYITDGAYLAELFPTSTLISGTSAVNNQSLCSWTPSSANVGTYSVISGTTPFASDGLRVPVVFFNQNGGTLPSAITAATVYYMGANNSAFEVYSASTGGSALNIQAGVTGTQYFATFYPISTNTESTSGTPLYTYANQQLVLPKFEIAQCLAEVGSQLAIGCMGNALYIWNQQDVSASNIVFLPEANMQTMVTAHQMLYLFPGNKGNIYLTDGSTASAVTTVPDYTAGVPGTPSSYIEPVFKWGGAMYLRGRVYFSILDQTATKAGNCGGVWSFTPTQNLYIGQDVGIGLRLENQNSYGTYSGVASILLPKANQNAIAPQYFSGWYSSVSGATYGIDATGTTFSPTTIIESDAIPTGTMLDKKTFSQIEFKLSSPLGTGDTVTLFYRKNLTGAWVSLGAVQLQSDRLSGYVSANFEKSQWLQIRTLLNASSTFIRLVEERIR